MYRFVCLGVFCVGCLVPVIIAESEGLRSPAKVEQSPKLSSSYIPAAMQIIAHDTELMKYVIKPPAAGTTTTTTTTVRPTRPHRPGVYSPNQALGPTAYFSPTNVAAHYVQLQQQPGGIDYFNRYHQVGRVLVDDDEVYGTVAEFLGKGFEDVLRLANRIDVDTVAKDEETEVLKFSKDFEDKDSPYKFELLRQKRVPPTKAYVTMLSLYDVLNKESKRLMLNKYAGYTDEVLDNLVQFSSSTSSYQLKTILNKIVENGDTKKSDIVTKISTLVTDLDQEGSYINEALKDIPPLAFAH